MLAPWWMPCIRVMPPADFCLRTGSIEQSKGVGLISNHDSDGIVVKDLREVKKRAKGKERDRVRVCAMVIKVSSVLSWSTSFCKWYKNKAQGHNTLQHQRTAPRTTPKDSTQGRKAHNEWTVRAALILICTQMLSRFFSPLLLLSSSDPFTLCLFFLFILILLLCNKAYLRRTHTPTHNRTCSYFAEYPPKNKHNTTEQHQRQPQQQKKKTWVTDDDNNNAKKETTKQKKLRRERGRMLPHWKGNKEACEGWKENRVDTRVVRDMNTWSKKERKEG